MATAPGTCHMSTVPMTTDVPHLKPLRRWRPRHRIDGVPSCGITTITPSEEPFERRDAANRSTAERRRSGLARQAENAGWCVRTVPRSTALGAPETVVERTRRGARAYPSRRIQLRIGCYCYAVPPALPLARLGSHSQCARARGGATKPAAQHNDQRSRVIRNHPSLRSRYAIRFISTT